MLINADDPDAVEPGRVVDQDALAFGQHGVVGGAPRHSERFGGAGDGQVLHHDRLQRPPQPTAGQSGPWFGGLAGVLPPHVPAPRTPIAADRHHQRRGSPAERLVRQLPHDAVARDALATAASAPLIRLDDPARQQRTVRLQALTGHDQTELVQSAERGQVGAGELSNSGSVRHVEVFQMDGVGTSILGRPRPLSRPRRADRLYTLIWDEPLNEASRRGSVFSDDELWADLVSAGGELLEGMNDGISEVPEGLVKEMEVVVDAMVELRRTRSRAHIQAADVLKVVESTMATVAQHGLEAVRYFRANPLRRSWNFQGDREVILKRTPVD